MRDAGLLDENAVARLVAKFADGRPVSETDEMALAGSMSLMILNDRLVANPRPAPALDPVPDRRRRQGRRPGRSREAVRWSSSRTACSPPPRGRPGKVAIVDEYTSATYAGAS